MDDSDADQRLPHHKEPKEYVSLDKLAGKHLWSMCLFNLSADWEVFIPLGLFRVDISELGVLSWRLDADNVEADPELKKIREDRGYNYMVCYTEFHFHLNYKNAKKKKSCGHSTKNKGFSVCFWLSELCLRSHVKFSIWGFILTFKIMCFWCQIFLFWYCVSLWGWALAQR